MPVFPAICKFTGFSYPMRGKSLSFYRGKVRSFGENSKLSHHFLLLILNRNVFEPNRNLRSKTLNVGSKTLNGGSKTLNVGSKTLNEEFI